MFSVGIRSRIVTDLLVSLVGLQEISSAQRSSARVDLKWFLDIFSRFWDNESSRDCYALFQTRFDFGRVSSISLFHNRFGFLLLNRIAFKCQVNNDNLK